MEKYSNINFQEAKAFLAMYEFKNTKQAGEEVDMSSSMVNLYINRFEKKLGYKLFLRNRRTGTFLPTKEAHEIAKYVRNMLFYADLVYSENRINDQKVTISSTIMILECFVVPYIKEFVSHNKEVLIGINQNDDLSFENPGFNEILLTNTVDDSSAYVYIPYHSYVQKLWASPEYIKDWGAPNKLEDLKNHWLILRKFLDNPASMLGSVYADSYIRQNPNFRTYEIKSPAIGYYLCEQGLGIMSTSEEAINLKKMKVENVFSEYKGHSIDMFLAVNKEFYETDMAKKVVNWLFECRDRALESIGMHPQHHYKKT